MGGGSANESSESLPHDTGGIANNTSEALPHDTAESPRSSVYSASEITVDYKGDKSFEEFTRDRPFLNWREKARKKLLLNYQLTESRVELLREAKTKLLSYVPGAWIEEVGGLRRTDYEIPKITTLLLIGPRRSGKSSLVNKISRVLEDGRFSVDRAQISYTSSSGEGTCFLHEYMIPRESNSFCIYDTRSLSTISEENFKVLKDWMIDGVQHGEKLMSAGRVRFSTFLQRLKPYQLHLKDPGVLANFVQPNCGFLTDDKPAVVVTHGDELLPSDRTEVCIFLGDLLGIPPEQIFDIPDESDVMMELAVTNLLFFCLLRADRNLPIKRKRPLFKMQDFKFQLITVVLVLLLASFVARIAWGLPQWPSNLLGWHAVQPSTNTVSVEWSKIRHLWL